MLQWRLGSVAQLMGFFGKRERVAKVPSDQRLVGAVVETGPNPRSRSYQLESIADLEPQILRTCSGNIILKVAADICQIGREILVVTTDGVLLVDKNGVKKRFAYGEVADTRIGVHPDKGAILRIETHSYRNDFLPGDYRAIGQLIQICLPTPGGVRQLAAIIDGHLPE